MTLVTNGYPTVTHKTPKIWPSVIAAMLLLLAAAAPAAAQSYTIMPTPFQAPLNDSGAIIVGGCVWTYAAGTTTPISTYTNTSGTTNTNPIIIDSTGRFTAYLLAGTLYKFVYETACTPPAHGSVLRTADNIAGVPSAAATVDMSCTAGEAISAGQAVYLSDGSGSKTQGQCYKGDSANAYSSSSATVFGIAPSAITSGQPGTVRIAGSVSGLSVTAGTDYYIGSSGALTSTAPVNARKLGRTDTATSIVLTLPAAIPTIPNATNDFRVSAATTSCASDATAATTIYLTPCYGHSIALPDATGATTIYSSAEISIAVPATTSQMYDVFVYANSGVPTLELLAWTNDTTRATAIVRTTTGFYTKSGDLTRRLVGSFRTTTVSGQTEDSVTKRYVSNVNNRVRRVLKRQETTATWGYSTATVREANGSTSNQVDVVVSVAELGLSLSLEAMANNSTGSTTIGVGIGEDSTTTYASVGGGGFIQAAGNYIVLHASLFTVPAVGRHVYSWNEWSQAVATTTWVGTVLSAGAGGSQGLSGWIEG